MDRVTVRIDQGDIFAGGARSKAKPPRVFIAFRFVPESENFRDQLRDALRSDWQIDAVHGGNVGLGANWPEEIRGRIKASDLVVADVTDASREVMFEIGFAGNKPVLYVTASHRDRESLPSWLTIRQGAAYSDDGVDAISRSVGRMCAKRSYPAALRRSTIPSTAVLIHNGDQPWVDPLAERIEALLGQAGVALTMWDATMVASARDLTSVLGAQFTFACVDGSGSDCLSHFALGDVAGRRTLSTSAPSGGRQILPRVGIVLSESQRTFQAFAAESLRRVSRDVVFHGNDVVSIQQKIAPALRQVKTWRSRGVGDGL